MLSLNIQVSKCFQMARIYVLAIPYFKNHLLGSAHEISCMLFLSWSHALRKSITWEEVIIKN